VKSCVGQTWEDLDTGEVFLIVEERRDLTEPRACKWTLFSLSGPDRPGRSCFLYAADTWFGSADTRRIA
jgi:hypothetical protein